MTGVVVQLIVEALVVYFMLVVIGYWIRALITSRTDRIAIPSSALFGLVILVATGWFVSYYADTGLLHLWPWLLLFSAVADAFAIWHRRKIIKWSALHRRSDLWANVAGGSLVVLVVIIERAQLLSRGILSIAGAYNLDSPSYAVSAFYVNHYGMSQAGWVTNVNIGNLVRGDAFGSYSFLGAIEWITHRPDFQIQLAALVVAIVLVVQALTGLLRNWFHLSDLWAVGLAVIAVSTWQFAYIASNYYLSEVLAIALSISLLDVTIESDRLRQDWSSGVILFALVEVGLLMMYPAEAFVFPMIIAVVVLMVHAREPRRLVSSVAFVVASSALAALVVLQRTYSAFHYFLFQASGVSGWKEPAVLLWGIVGGGSWASAHTPAAWALSDLVLVAWAAALIASSKVRGTHSVTLPMIVFGTVILFYIYICVKLGESSYNQWKWITFVGPLLVVLLLAPIISWLLDHFDIGWVIAAGVVLFIVISNLRVSVLDSRSIDKTAFWVPSELGTLSDSSAWKDVGSVNVDLPGGWSMMWAVDTLAPRQLQLLQPTYYTRSRPVAAWTLVGFGDNASYPPSNQMVSTPHQQIRIVNGLYALVKSPTGKDLVSPETTAGTIHLLHVTSATTTSPMTVRVDVRNTGRAIWLPPERDSDSVSLVVSVLGKSHTVIERELLIAPIREWPFILDLGKSQEENVVVTRLPKGATTLQFNLVLGNTRAFASFGGGSPLDVQIHNAGDLESAHDVTGSANS